MKGRIAREARPTVIKQFRALLLHMAARHGLPAAGCRTPFICVPGEGSCLGALSAHLPPPKVVPLPPLPVPAAGGIRSCRGTRCGVARLCRGKETAQAMDHPSRSPGTVRV
ncbi:hypothetical protein GCM10014715_88390 [Streptomyces spiralis]|uniref:Uncharacterized protein n=1 Tax=Streptomyces spiralis TaxID=66376 RepID=A0A919AQR1_9ACTN|nr:hypothetical protein GCM10014715_88390 [Streptomyces spiralis]